MRTARGLGTLVALLVVPATAAAIAAVPQMINYQGRLTNGSGEPLDTTVKVGQMASSMIVSHFTYWRC